MSKKTASNGVFAAMRPLVAGSATAIRLIKLSFFPNNGMYSASPVQRMQDAVHYMKKTGRR